MNLVLWRRRRQIVLVLVLESLLAISVLARRSLLHILMLPHPAHSSRQVAVLLPPGCPDGVDV
jgi:hypothetical protein